MSIATIQNKILESFQVDSTCNAEFKTVLSGTISASAGSKDVVGAGTTFLTDLKPGAYIGNVATGYRKVESVTDDTHFVLCSAFTGALVDMQIDKIEIKKGFPRNVEISECGKSLRVALVSAADREISIGAGRVEGIYAFLVIAGFIEIDADSAEDAKSRYDIMLRNVIDADPTFGGAAIGTTIAGRANFIMAPTTPGLWYGIMPLVVKRHETRGNR